MQRAPGGQSPDPVERRGPRLLLDEPADEEQHGLDRDLVDEEQDRTGDARHREQPEAHEHVADLADDVERQDPLDVVLGQRAGDADDHRDAGDDAGSADRGRPSR